MGPLQTPALRYGVLRGPSEPPFGGLFSRAEVGSDYVDLGSLKGNMGNQNYEIPTDLDLSDYQGVVIYCMPFHVVFATASLN